VAHWAAGVPAATVPVPAGVPGLLVVAAVTVLVVVLWRWRWFRVVAGWAMAVIVVCLAAWSLSGLVGPA
jgi:competence protein ComEC